MPDLLELTYFTEVLKAFNCCWYAFVTLQEVDIIVRIQKIDLQTVFYSLQKI